MPTDALEPVHIPAEFWQRPDVVTALHHRDIGALFNLVRRHTGASQTRIGIAVGMPQGDVSRIMRPGPRQRRVTALDVITRIAGGLHMPDTARVNLGLAHHSHPDAADDTPTVTAVPIPSPRTISTEVNPAPVELDAGPWISSKTIDIVGHLTREDLAMDRREATRTIAGMVFGGALLERLERWLSPDQQPEPATRRPPGVGHEEVTQIEHAAQLFRSWDHQFGGGLRRKAVVGQLSEVTDELRNNNHPTHLRKRLFAVMAQLAATCATMSWDSSQGALAQKYYIHALRAAKEAEDRAFGANILAGMARQLFYLDRVSEGLELVRLAQDGLHGHGTPTIAAMLYTREAWAYARQGRLAAFGRVTSKAEDALRDTRPVDDPYWITYFDEAELAGVTGGRLLEAAAIQPEYADEAETYIGRAVELRRARSLRSTALDQLGLAETRFIQRQPEEASTLGHHAMDIADQTRSDRVRVKLAELYDQTRHHATVPAVAELRDRINESLRPAATATA